MVKVILTLGNGYDEMFKQHFNAHPFRGSIAKPYNLANFRTGRVKANPRQLVQKMTLMSQFMNNGGKSNVKFNAFHIVALSESVFEHDLYVPYPSSTAPHKSMLVAAFDNRGVGYLCARFSGVACNIHNSACSYKELVDALDELDSTYDYYAFTQQADKNRYFNAAFNDCTPNFYLIGNRILVNADDDANTYSDGIPNAVGLKLPPKCLPISFKCLARLATGNENSFATHANQFKVLQIIDYESDKKMEVSSNVLNALRNILTNSPQYIDITNKYRPSQGYSLIYDSTKDKKVWHKSGSVLLTYTYKGKEHCALFGQDDGSYFGCVLPVKAKTIAEAYKLLKPACIRNLPDNKVKRQGEWFVVEIADKHLPAIKDRAYYPLEMLDRLPDKDSACVLVCTLPKENIDSNDHNLSIDIPRPTYLVKSKIAAFTFNGRVYCTTHELNTAIQLAHREHPTLTLNPKCPNTWYMFIRNTAIASYSAEKVD